MIPFLGINLDFIGDGATELSKNAPVLFILAVIIIAFFVVLLLQNRFTVKQIRKAYDTSRDDLKEQFALQTKELRKSYRELQEDHKELQKNFIEIISKKK